MPKLSKRKRYLKEMIEKRRDILNQKRWTCHENQENTDESDQYQTQHLPATISADKNITTQTNNADTGSEINAKNVELSTSLPVEVESSYEIESIKKQTESPPAFEGRRIINLINVYKKLQDISTHGPFNCNLKCVDIISEKQIGLHSTFTLQCKLCKEFFCISSDEGSDININNSAVLGMIAIGCGHSQLQEFSAAVDLPLMGETTYQKCHEKIADTWEGISAETMNDSAKEERDLATSEGRVDENGIPIIDVIVDGCWCKRTYKKNYSALSGAAAIIGKRTGKILYLGVKNKYCCICAQAQYKKEEPRNHKCFKNYTGPSTGMESNILVEGFKCSIEMHSLIYGRMISDGDSSTYSKIIEARPYANVTVQKIECKNHIMRNMCNKLAQLKTDTKYPSKLRKNITDKKIIAIRGTIKKAMEKYTSDSESEKRAHVELLYNDILLAHMHAFGDHSRCKTYFCKTANEESSIEQGFMTSSIWSRICQIISNVASYAPSLVHNVESNKVENFNSKIAKLVGGKRINFSLKGGYETRCKGAAISHNTRALLSKTYSYITGKSPQGKIKLLEQRRLKRYRMMRKCNRKRNKLLFCKGEDLNYGENCTREDIAPEIMEKEKTTFLSNLRKTEEERHYIEKETILQSASSEWLELRRKLLTASNFGRVIKRRPDISCGNLVKDLLYKDCISHVKSIKHGLDNEKIAIEQLSLQNGIQIERCGLFLDEKIPYLGASPDGISNDMTVEVKCPISSYKLNFEEAVRKKKVPFFKLNKNGEININKNHNWYYQIQGQLHITKKSKCLFGLWLGENVPMHTEIIEKDDTFWNDEMEAKLIRFYCDCILPELIDPRQTRKLTIRDPNYIQEAMKKKNEKIVEKTSKKKASEDTQIKDKKEKEAESQKQKCKKRNHTGISNEKQRKKKRARETINNDDELIINKDITERNIQMKNEKVKEAESQKQKCKKRNHTGISNEKQRKKKRARETINNDDELIINKDITERNIQMKNEKVKEAESQKQKCKKRNHTGIGNEKQRKTKQARETIKNDDELNINKDITERNIQMKNEKVKESKIINKEKENILIATSNFPKVIIQNVGESSDDEEVYTPQRKPLAGRQLNFNEF